MSLDSRYRGHAMVAVGPGFSVDTTLQTLLSYQGYTVEEFSINHGFKKLNEAAFEKAGLVVFRGPWSEGPEDTLLTRMMAERSKSELKNLILKNPQKTVLGIGRGARYLLDVCLTESTGVGRVGWVDLPSSQIPWLETQFVGNTETKFRSLVTGRAVPQFPESSPFIPCLQSTDGIPCGWKLSSQKIFISTLDPFAFTDPSQLEGYGYESTESVLTHENIMTWVLENV